MRPDSYPLAGEHPDQPTFLWSGRAWYARDSVFRPGGPGRGGDWSRRNVLPGPNGSLTLAITNPSGSSPIASEIISRESFGYGTYTVTAECDFARLPPAYVFGVFTFDWATPAPADGYTEIDAAEISSWGASTLPTVSHAYHPDAGGTRSVGSQVWPSDCVRATFQLSWRPDSLRFRVFRGGGTWGVPFADHGVESADVPAPRREAVHVNLWDGSWGGRPAGGQSSPPSGVRLLRFDHTR